MKLRLGAVSLLLAVSAACADSGQSSGDDAERVDPSSSTSEQSSTPTSTPTTTPTSKPATKGPCAPLDAATIRELTGEDLQGQEATVPGSDLPACLYGRLDGVGVQVAQVPAGEWARALPALADQIEAADALGDQELRRRLEEGAQLIESGRTIPSERACGLFTDLLELQRDVPAGSDYVITYIPSDKDPQAASGQACVDGTFTSVGVGMPGLEVGAELEAALEAALQEALASTTSS
ncbi:hypothetical protein GCM10011376_15570 [Nocardioides flavus (ex Wang et al. 2016)]|uniref:DUF3558 domain-containing protein n=1 Tax=Nocardioides flavus (ex Wang et al. 2016) TaxID=2058780 RepID=A0ABQ3HH34_9ACTN|nr:hypothetical protein [Nocardioides flavus (ex Wang et al. 2016)]GHE16947.1 hypothetical protein GCM10011376_15570 [Nocardioides flavus (ex Wang et al. 2016)]